MAKAKTLGTAKRFGPRYGKTVKEKFAKIEKEVRKKHKCPYCNKVSVRRISAGIWSCSKCGKKFTGKAYSPLRRVIGKEKQIEVIEELTEEELQEEPKKEKKKEEKKIEVPKKESETQPEEKVEEKQKDI